MNMIHRFERGIDSEAPTLLLLHGTGGTENDLIDIGRTLSPTSALLSVRGQELERGMPRFFKRLSEGIFDIDNLIFRTQELNEELNKAAEQYHFDRSKVVAVGYSNGANIAGSLLFHHEQSLQAAILFHPMVPRRGIDLPSLSGVNVWIGAGRNDPLCPPQETEDLTQLLQEAGATVDVFWHNEGHQLTREEIEQATAWFSSL